VDILAKIIEKKRGRLVATKKATNESQLEKQAIEKCRNAEPHRLLTALKNKDRINIIAEFKRKSPSRGFIRGDLSPDGMARRYAAGGAAAISVLTEEDHFSGSLSDLRLVREAVSLPVLRKDFIVDKYQLYETAVAGADALLLITAALDDDSLVSLRTLAEEQLGLDALIEVHTREELERAIASGAQLIGVNNRDLKTFEVSLDASLALASEAPETCVLISESGLSNSADLALLHSLGYKGFLLGESLMRADDPESMLKSIIEEAQSKELDDVY
jgi:indole-3-glycerol phosphate synthase